MNRVSKFFGWVFAAFAMMALAMGILASTEGEQSKGAASAGFFFTAVMGAPAAILLLTSRRREKKAGLQGMIDGYINSRDRFTISEMSQHTGLTPDALERKLLEYMGKNPGANLLFHPAAHEYIKRDKIRQDYEVKDSCKSCGAQLPETVIMQGETINCRYCGNAL